MKLTPKRLAWLRRLAADGPAPERGRGNVGFFCMQAGWVAWNYVNADGEDMAEAEARERYGERYWEHVRVRGERLTEAGRKLLEANQ